jgi:chorismate synthase
MPDMNSLGTVFQCITWGESHGEAIGCIVDGCPAGLELTPGDLLMELNRDVPDECLGTTRREQNQVHILSGMFDGQTIGTPICLVIPNTGHRSQDYDRFKHCYRPGHAEFGYHQRYGIYDYRGGGRASGRVCIAYLAAGAIAKKLLEREGIAFQSRVVELAGIPYEDDTKEDARRKCLEIAASGDSSGGIIALRITGVPPGVGSPVFGKLHSLIMYAVSTIGGVKGVECGLGFEASRLTGSTFNDPFGLEDGQVKPLSNHAGGVLGGISTGLDLEFRIAVKPTSSIARPQKTVNWELDREDTLSVTGRFDSNFTPRVGPIAEALAAIMVTDQLILTSLINPVRVREVTRERQAT